VSDCDPGNGGHVRVTDVTNPTVSSPPRRYISLTSAFGYKPAACKAAETATDANKQCHNRCRQLHATVVAGSHFNGA